MFNKMVGTVKPCVIKTDNKCYLLFEKEEYYEILFYLEKVILDLIKNNILSNLDEHGKIRVFFRMSVIENYVKKLPKIEIETFVYEKVCGYSFEKKFPNLWSLDCCDSLFEDILLILVSMDLKVKFLDLAELINDKIRKKFLLRISF